MWQLFDDNGVLYHTLTHLSDYVAASSTETPVSSVTNNVQHNVNNKRKKDEMRDMIESRKRRQQFEENVVNAFGKLAYSNLQRNVIKLLWQIREVKGICRRTDDVEEKEEIDADIANLKVMVNNLQMEMESVPRVNSTTNANSTTSAQTNGNTNKVNTTNTTQTTNWKSNNTNTTKSNITENSKLKTNSWPKN